jgi:type I restriction enzyme S subunit
LRERSECAERIPGEGSTRRTEQRSLFGDGFPFEACAINEHVYRLRAKNEIGQNFLFFWLSSERAKEEMRVRGTGVAIPGLNSTQVRSPIALKPTPDVAQAFNQLIEPLVSRVLANCNESRTLTLLRDTLLPKLISGELRVKDVERQVEALV